MAKKKKENGSGFPMVKASDYTLCHGDEITDVMEAIQAATGGERLQAGDLEMIKVPAGGGIAWEVPSLDGIESEKEVVGVILHQKDVRAYWNTSFEDSAGAPPDCFSEDSLLGIGKPGGSCRDCPYAEFGSADGGEGRGQACRSRRLLFILRADDLIPVIVSVPPTSIRAVKKKMLQLASKRINPRHVEFAFSLEKTKSQDGITFSKVVPKVRRKLPPELIARVDEYLKATGLTQIRQVVEAKAEEAFG